MAVLDTHTNHRGPGDQFMDGLHTKRNELGVTGAHPLDGEDAKKELRQLLG